jgi:putative endonuclease
MSRPLPGKRSSVLPAAAGTIFSTKRLRIFRGRFYFMTYYCYIIYSRQLDRFYVGHTEDLSIRVDQHRSGASKYTSKATDWELVYKEQFADRLLAQRREREIKQKKAGSILNGS